MGKDSGRYSEGVGWDTFVQDQLGKNLVNLICRGVVAGKSGWDTSTSCDLQK